MLEFVSAHGEEFKLIGETENAYLQVPRGGKVCISIPAECGKQMAERYGWSLAVYVLKLNEEIYGERDVSFCFLRNSSYNA